MSRLQAQIRIDHGNGEEPIFVQWSIGGGVVRSSSIGPSMYPKEIKLLHLLTQVFDQVRHEYEAPPEHHPCGGNHCSVCKGPCKHG